MKKLKIKKKVQFILIIALLITFVILGVSLYFVNINKYKKYEKYEAVMDMYGFSTLYNNKTSRSSENVTNIEALKILIAASLNNQENVISLNNNLQTNEAWYNYAKNANVLYEGIEENDLNKKARFIQVIKQMSDCKINILRQKG